MAQINPQFIARMAQQLLGITSKIIAVAQTDDGTEDIKKLQDKHYEESMKVAKKIHKAAQKEQTQAPVDLSLSQDLQEKLEHAKHDIDMTAEKIEKGTSCLPCSRDHVSVAAGLLEEAVRFAKRPDEGIRSQEVRKRVQKALLELNNLERVDLSSENTVGLRGKEKEIADWTMNTSAELRHRITSIRNADDLVSVSATAQKAAQKLNDSVWDLMLAEDGGVDKRIDDICRGLSGDELKVCRERISNVIESRG
jgi:hypothetical protein